MSPRTRGRGKALGPVLRAVREERGKTREQLAVDAGLAVGTLAHLELDQSEPGWNTITAILDALGLTLADLAKLMDDDDAHGPPGDRAGAAQGTPAHADNAT
jgi:transcriptional regulator with XRE-family HTH domain